MDIALQVIVGLWVLVLVVAAPFITAYAFVDTLWTLWRRKRKTT